METYIIRYASITILPRKDNKEAWDNIDIFGWMGYPMEIKVNFLCRDSILAAPIALDLVLFSDLAHACRYVWYPNLVVFLLQESDARLRTSART